MVGAVGGKATGLAAGGARRAGVAAVEDEPVVRYGYLALRNMLRELLLSLQGGATVARQPYAVGHTEDMSVHG